MTVCNICLIIAVAGAVMCSCQLNSHEEAIKDDILQQLGLKNKTWNGNVTEYITDEGKEEFVIKKYVLHGTGKSFIWFLK